MNNGLIIAHYNEDLVWLDKINIPKIIYSKTNKKYNLVPGNKGQEIPCFLKYIIDFYDNLPDKTLFLHGHRMSGHQDFNTDSVIPVLNWNLDSFFSINKRDWYQEISKTVYFDEGAYDVWLKQNWYMFEEYLPFPECLKFYSGAQFVVNKELITQYPISFYKKLYNWIQTTELTNFITSRIFEYTWHYIFTKNPIEKKYEHKDIFITPPSSN
jgi:hypothetical protein